MHTQCTYIRGQISRLNAHACCPWLNPYHARLAAWRSNQSAMLPVPFVWRGGEGKRIEVRWSYSGEFPPILVPTRVRTFPHAVAAAITRAANCSGGEILT